MAGINYINEGEYSRPLKVKKTIVVEQSKQFYCDGQENNKDRCKTQCLGCSDMQEIYGK